MQDKPLRGIEQFVNLVALKSSCRRRDNFIASCEAASKDANVRPAAGTVNKELELTWVQRVFTSNFAYYW